MSLDNKALQNHIVDALEARKRAILRPNFCYTCNGTGAVRKPVDEWTEGEHEYHAIPRVDGSPVKVCPSCNGKGELN